MAYRTTIDFWKRIYKGDIPVICAVITTGAGTRAYARKAISAAVGSIENSAKLISVGSLERSILPRTRELINSYSSRTLQHCTITLDNRDYYFSKLIAKEPFLTKTLTIYALFEDLYAASGYIKLFTGTISEVSMGPECVVEAEEGSTLADYFYLPRAARYTNPQNDNSRLPIVYGYLVSNGSNGTGGFWELPCIDTSSYVYCYSASSVAETNPDVNIFKDGVSLASTYYTFDASTDFESQGVIATVKFTTSMTDGVITARGYGKVSATAAETRSPIWQINNFMVNHVGYAGTIVSNKAAANMNSTQYFSDGAITQDAPTWNILQEWVGSYLGQVFIDGSNQLNIYWEQEQDTNYQLARIIPESDVKILSCSQKRNNLINKIRASAFYNYAKMEFEGHINSTTYDDAASQSLYGVQEPKTPLQMHWARNYETVDYARSFLTGKYAYPIWEVVIEDQTLKRSDIDLNDLVALTVKDLYDWYGSQYTYRVWRVVSISPDFQRGKVRFRLIDTGNNMDVVGITGAGGGGGGGAVCTESATMKQETQNAAYDADAAVYAQKVKNDAPGDNICKFQYLLKCTSGTNSCKVRICTDLADPAGSQVGDLSDAVTISGAIYTWFSFEWSGTKPNPAGDYFAQLVNLGAGTGLVLGANSASTSYQDTTYDLFAGTTDVNDDACFKVWTEV